MRAVYDERSRSLYVIIEESTPPLYTRMGGENEDNDTLLFDYTEDDKLVGIEFLLNLPLDITFELERLRNKVAELLDAPDWGEEYLREMDERKRQGDRAHKWKTRAEAAESEAERLRAEVEEWKRTAAGWLNEALSQDIRDR